MEQIPVNLLDDIRGFFEHADEMLVVTHFFPDGDAVGSLIAFGGMLDQLGIPCMLAVDDACPEKYSFLSGFERIRNLKTDPLNRVFEAAAVLDAGALQRVGSARGSIGPKTRIINVDHHFTGDLYGNVNVVDVDASATSEILYEICMALGLKVTSEMAYALYVGILTDTGRFRFANTTARSMHVSADLIALGVDTGLVTESVYYNMPVAQAHTLARALSAMEFHFDNRICLIGLEEQGGTHDTEGFVEYAASIKGVDVAGFYCEMEPGMFKVSLRSRCDVDVSEIASTFGGGGHRKASGYRFRGDVKILKTKLLEICAARLKDLNSSSDLKIVASR